MDAPGSILLVEDNDDDAFFFEKAVQRLGVSLKVERATDGAAAVEYLMKQLEACGEDALTTPSLVMLDLKLPRMGGFEVLEWIRQHKELSQLWVSVLSSSGEEVDRLRASYLKADAFFVKPISIEEYYVMVQRIWEEWLLPRISAREQEKKPVAEAPPMPEQSKKNSSAPADQS
jgi:CheY-like chemotaxis protein